MKFSVIMSIYNTTKFLKKAIESIINQDYKDFEFIIIDDGSKDNSFKIIKHYAKQDKRIKIIRNRNNIGLTKSLNKGIKISRGEFVVRQDGDDIFLPNHLDRFLKFFQENPGYAFCGCDGYQIQNTKNLVLYYTFDEIEKNLIGDNCFNHPGMVIRKDILEKVGYYDEKYQYGQDYELWCRIIYKYQYKATNIMEKLIIRDMPDKKFFKKNLKKFLIQRFNALKTKFKYIKYTRYKLKTSISILLTLIEITTITPLGRFFTPILKKINM